MRFPFFALGVIAGTAIGIALSLWAVNDVLSAPNQIRLPSGVWSCERQVP